MFSYVTDRLTSAQRGLYTFFHFSFDIRFFLLGISGPNQKKKNFLTVTHVHFEIINLEKVDFYFHFFVSQQILYIISR